MHHIFLCEKNVIDNIVRFEKCDDIDEFNHLKNSLRVSIGEDVLVSIVDNKLNFDYFTKVISISDDEINFKIIDKRNVNELKYKINLYQGLPKYDKFEYIVEKAVELGVNSITPVIMDTCVTKIKNEKVDKKIERFNNISKSASIQSKRSIIPVVKNYISFNDMLNEIKNDRYNFLFYENEEGMEKTRDILNKMTEDIKENENINIIIGPEGGFTNMEINKTHNFNINILSLGNRILRTETASITALSIFMYILEGK